MQDLIFKIKRKIIRYISKTYIFIKTPRLSLILFQVRYIERYTGIDTFFLSPRRTIIYFIERFILNHQDSILLQDYGNYKLVKNKISNNAIVYSGGVGTNITFDLAINKIHRAKVRLFDPTKNSIEYMKQFKARKNIYFYPYALYHKNKKVKLYYDSTNRVKSNSITNFFEFNKKNYYFAEARNIIFFLKKFKDKKIDILKLDIEGVAEDLLIQTLKKKIYPKQIIFALEVPLNYFKFFKFLIKFFKLLKFLNKNYDLYNIRNRARGVEMEILAVKK